MYIDKQLNLMPVSVMRNHITTTPHLYFVTENSISKMVFLSSIFLTNNRPALSTKSTIQNHSWTLNCCQLEDLDSGRVNRRQQCAFSSPQLSFIQYDHRTPILCQAIHFLTLGRVSDIVQSASSPPTCLFSPWWPICALFSDILYP